MDLIHFHSKYLINLKIILKNVLQNNNEDGKRSRALLQARKASNSFKATFIQKTKVTKIH